MYRLKRWICLFVFSILLFGCGQDGKKNSNVELSGNTDASIHAVIEKIAHHHIQTLENGKYPDVHTLEQAMKAKEPEGIAWTYPWGVALYGMEHVADVTGDTAITNFVLEHNRICGRYYVWLESLRKKLQDNKQLEGFLDHTKLGEFMILDRLDFCGAMGAQMLEGALHTNTKLTPDERTMLDTIAVYITQKQARLPDSTLWRPKVMGGTIWADDLYMSCPFLVRWYEYTGDRKYIDDAAHQIINMAKRLQDTDGVWYHGYFVNKHERSPYKWGRANGWAMVATVEVLSALPDHDPNRDKLLDILRKHISGIEKLQAGDGMWHQVLDHPELWEETSCSAMFAYSIARAVNRGWIAPSNMKVARKAFEGICQHVTPNGMVNGTCQGTGIGTTLQFYKDRKRPSDDMHGPGPVMLAGAEILVGSQH